MIKRKTDFLLVALLSICVTCMMPLTAFSQSSETEEGASVNSESSAEQTENTGEGPIQDTVVAGWHIVTQKDLIDTSLENISVALGYTGVETSEFKKTADEGYTFCLINLLIEKAGSKEVIDWENMVLTDSEGNVYHRIADEFILDLGMKRMPGTKLNFGANEGWIAYEIPMEAASGLTLSYEFKDETYSCEITAEDAK